MKKEKIQKIVLVIIVVITLIYAYINYLFLPKWTSIQKQKEQLQDRQGYYRQLLTQQSNQAGLARTILSLEGEGKDLAAQIPSQLDKPQIMADIYTIAKLHAIDPQTLKFEPLQNKGDHQELAMNLSYSGQTEDILSLIDDLEHTPLHKFALQSINLTVSKAANGVDNTNISLQNKLSVNKIVYGDNSSQTPELIIPTKLNVELKFVAYSSSIGTKDGTNIKPWFMFSQFGADSIAKMFAP